MKKLPKLGMTFLHGDKLGNINAKTDGLFPLYIYLRLGKTRTKLKSITAKYWFDIGSSPFISEEYKIKTIEKDIKKYIERDTKFIHWVRELHIKAFDKDLELKFLQNQIIQYSLNVPIKKAFNGIVQQDIYKSLVKNKMEDFANLILPMTEGLVLAFCMHEINSNVDADLKKNETITTLLEVYSKYSETSFIEFLHAEIPKESVKLKEIQSNLIGKTIQSFKNFNADLFSET